MEDDYLDCALDTAGLFEILADPDVLVNLSLFLPSACMRIRKLNRKFMEFFDETRIEWLLPQVFDILRLDIADPFDVILDGCPESLWLMIVHGLDLNTRDSEGSSLLQKAVHSGRVGRRTLVQPPEPIDESDRDDNSAISEVECGELSEASLESSIVGWNRRALLSLLIERGLSVNSRAAFGYTCLHEVAYSDDPVTAEWILKRGGNVDALSQNGSTALLIAAREGRRRVADILLKWGADPDDGGDRGWTPLFLAASQGHGQVVSLLAEYGADLNFQCYVSITVCTMNFFRREEQLYMKLWITGVGGR